MLTSPAHFSRAQTLGLVWAGDLHVLVFCGTPADMLHGTCVITVSAGGLPAQVKRLASTWLVATELS